ncbi:hypothetical protein [Phyllobacterium sp. SB3]|uniref:hypothetical protein n=1 Tax=Phyllobacterium sp. SB3 TaxID=3156073 RepID=UPI0032AFDA34
MNAWLATVVGDTAAPIVGFILLFALVIILLLLVFAVLRRVTGGTFVAGGRNRQVRLSVTDAAAVDNRRRLVLVRRDDVEHLIMIGGPSDVVIEQNIRQFAKQPSRIEPAANGISEPDVKNERKPVEPPRAEPVSPAPQATAPVARPAAPVQPAPQVPLRTPTPQPVPPRDVPQAPRQQTAPTPLPPIPPMAPIPPITATPEPARTPHPYVAPVITAAAIAANEAPTITAPVRDSSNSWERTASPSFGSETRAEPVIEAPEPEIVAPEPARQFSGEQRASTAAAFPFAARNEPIYREPTLDNIEPEETSEPEITLSDADFSDAFDPELTSELNITPGGEVDRDEQPKKADDIEDEMERLLGDLSRPDR